MTQSITDTATLRGEIVRLAPWHLDVQVTPDLGSSASLDARPADGDNTPEEISFINPRPGWEKLMRKIYPDGLGGESFLDCACNCGGYSFWAKELGAKRCYGFDVRRHWIDQARFLLEHRPWPSDGIQFEELDLYDLPQQGLEPFDLTLFKGIFYHLPDPIAGLKLAADLTREVLIVDTNVRIDLPDGYLVMQRELIEHPMSGVYGLNWLPTGPTMMARILNWMGFPETRVTSWVADGPSNGEQSGRLQIIGAREAGRLAQLRSAEHPTLRGHMR